MLVQENNVILGHPAEAFRSAYSSEAFFFVTSLVSNNRVIVLNMHCVYHVCQQA